MLKTKDLLSKILATVQGCLKLKTCSIKEFARENASKNSLDEA